MSAGLLQLSGVVVDLVHQLDHLPAPGEEVETATFQMTPGGGFNAMAAARRMGISVSYGGVLGTGPLAGIARQGLDAEGIAVAAPGRASIDQGSCVVIVDGAGERSFITHHGAEREVDAGHLGALSASTFAFALLTGYSLYKPKSAAAFLSWLPGLPRPPLLFFDPGPIVADIPLAVLAPVLARADWVSANRREAAVLTGTDDPAEAATRLARGRAGAMVRNGAEGCWLCHAGQRQQVPGFLVAAIDTNGAGDAHDGVFIAAMIMGLDPDDAARFANAAAGISTTRIGPATSPDLVETHRFLAARGVSLAVQDGRARVQPGATDAHQEEDSA